MEVEMKSVRVLFGIALAVVFLASVQSAYSSQAAPPVQRAAAAEKTMTCQLTKVDTAAKLISVKDPDQKEMMFSYNDDTQVISPEKTVQGLTGKSGAQLKITYHEERGANLATKIELVEAK
jgi:YD repeat-containing protein